MNQDLETLTSKISKASSLLKTPLNYSKYVFITINDSLCCPSCWPRAWYLIEKCLVPEGYLKDHSENIIEQDDVKLIFNHQESGSEIIAYLGLGTASISLITAIINIILVTRKFKANELDTPNNHKLDKRDDASVKDISLLVKCIKDGDRIIEEKTTKLLEIGELICELTNEKYTKDIYEGVKEALAKNSSLDIFAQKYITFRIHNPSARSVMVAGTFNNWQGTSMYLSRKGYWTTTMELPSGLYYYKFIVDSNWMVDPNNSIFQKDSKGNINSVLYVQHRGDIG